MCGDGKESYRDPATTRDGEIAGMNVPVLGAVTSEHNRGDAHGAIR